MTDQNNEQSQFELFKNELNDTAGDGNAAFTHFNSWDMSQGAVLQKLYRTHRKYIHDKLDTPEAKAMAKWLFKETGEEFKEGKKLDSKDVIKQMTIFAFSSPEVRKKDSQRDKLKNTITVIYKLHDDEDINVETDIVGTLFKNGVEAYRLKKTDAAKGGSAGNETRKEKIERASKKASELVSKTQVSLAKSEWGLLVQDANAVVKDNKDKFMTAVGVIDEFGAFNIVGVVPTNDSYVGVKESKTHEAVLVAWIKTQDVANDIAVNEMKKNISADLIASFAKFAAGKDPKVLQESLDNSDLSLQVEEKPELIDEEREPDYI